MSATPRLRRLDCIASFSQGPRGSEDLSAACRACDAV